MLTHVAGMEGHQVISDLLQYTFCGWGAGLSAATLFLIMLVSFAQVFIVTNYSITTVFSSLQGQRGISPYLRIMSPKDSTTEGSPFAARIPSVYLCVRRESPLRRA